jgi:hypothetical protein
MTVAPLVAQTPIPAGRARWRLTLHRRDFTDPTNSLQGNFGNTIVGELTDARGRRLDRTLNGAAQVTFTLDGDDATAPLVTELGTDVVFWRWDETLGYDVAMARALVDASEDQITEQSASVTFTGHDRFALLNRRIATSTINYAQTDQDTIVAGLVNTARTMTSSSGTSFTPGAETQLLAAAVNPDGTSRAASGQLRDRTYLGNQVLGGAIDDLAHVIGGFDYDVRPLTYPGAPDNTPPISMSSGRYDVLRVFYPSQGITRTDFALQYGSTVSAFTRTVSSTDYANYVRLLGNNASADPNTAQVFAEAWNTDSNNVTVNPVGLWQSAQNASDVTQQSTLNDQAQGFINLNGLLVPTYTVTLRQGAYRYGVPSMGDLVPFIADVGRLNVVTTLRVVGISFVIGEDGDETVELTVGRPAATLASYLSQSARDIDALARR